MGLVFRKRKRFGASSFLNLSRSGASVAKKEGPLTVNSRGRASIRLGKGFSFRFKL